jgi:hypothetical protein
MIDDVPSGKEVISKQADFLVDLLNSF